MIDPLRRYIEAATGLTQVTKSAAERIVKNLVQQGAAAGNPQELVENLLERSRENREALAATVRTETRRIVKSMGLASQDEVEKLEREVRDLRRRLREAEAAQPSAERPAKKTAKKTTKKTAKKPAKKKPAKKSTKQTAKKTTKKSTKKQGGSS